MVQMWPDQKGHGPFGELSVHCAQDVTKAWSAAFFETMKRRKNAEQAKLPLRKRWLVPVTWRKGEFALSAGSEGRRARAALSTARGYANLELALSGDHPYGPELVRAVRLIYPPRKFDTASTGGRRPGSAANASLRSRLPSW